MLTTVPMMIAKTSNASPAKLMSSLRRLLGLLRGGEELT
jgi:hypothetical protein